MSMHTDSEDVLSLPDSFAALSCLGHSTNRDRHVNGDDALSFTSSPSDEDEDSMRYDEACPNGVSGKPQPEKESQLGFDGEIEAVYSTTFANVGGHPKGNSNIASQADFSNGEVEKSEHGCTTENTSREASCSQGSHVLPRAQSFINNHYEGKGENPVVFPTVKKVMRVATALLIFLVLFLVVGASSYSRTARLDRTPPETTLPPTPLRDRPIAPPAPAPVLASARDVTAGPALRATKFPVATLLPTPTRITSAPTKEPPALDPREEEIVTMLGSHPFSFDKVEYPNNGETPEEKALNWIVDADPARLNGTSVTRLNQRYALASLWFATAPDSWTGSNFWLTEEHECFWSGVSACNESGEIQVIRLSSNNLVGHIPKGFGFLTSLRRLYLNGNSLVGTIPSSLAACTELVVLNLADNELTGSIPASFSGLSNIRFIQLKENELSGSLAPSFSSWNDIAIVSLGQNRLTGSIPTSYESWTSLRKLRLHDNHFTGLLPGFPQWHLMSEIMVQNNDFSGALPEIGDAWPRIETIVVGSNERISGTLPTSYSNWANLTEFWLYETGVEGTIPTEYGRWTKAESVVLRHNNLVGSLPEALGAWSRVKAFSATANELTGTVPTSFSKWTALEELWLAENELSGTFADSFAGWRNLAKFVVSDNKFSGTIPQSFSSWEGLTHFDISNNMLSGTVPADLAQWMKLRRGFFQENQFEGGSVPFCGIRWKVQELGADCDKVKCACCSHCNRR